MPDVRTLVTGATGFVGRHLVPALGDAGHEMAAIVRPSTDATPLLERGVEVLVDDGDAATLTKALQSWAPEHCIHLATFYRNHVGADEVDALVEGNVAFGTRVAQAFAEAGGSTFVYASTFSQHRDGQAYEPMNLYAATKQALADILRWYATSGQFQVIDLQLFDTIGGGDPRPKIWNLLMTAVETGNELGTTPGEQILCPVHVSDATAALVHAVATSGQHGPGYHEFHVPGPEAVTLRTAVERFETVNNVKVPIAWGARPYSGNEMFALWTNGPALPLWSPQVSLNDGLKEIWLDRQQIKEGHH